MVKEWNFLHHLQNITTCTNDETLNTYHKAVFSKYHNGKKYTVWSKGI